MSGGFSVAGGNPFEDEPSIMGYSAAMCFVPCGEDEAERWLNDQLE